MPTVASGTVRALSRTCPAPGPADSGTTSPRTTMDSGRPVPDRGLRPPDAGGTFTLHYRRTTGPPMTTPAAENLFTTETAGLPEVASPGVLLLHDGDRLNLRIARYARGPDGAKLRMLAYNWSAITVQVTNDGDVAATVAGMARGWTSVTTGSRTRPGRRSRSAGSSPTSSGSLTPVSSGTTRTDLPDVARGRADDLAPLVSVCSAGAAKRDPSLGGCRAWGHGDHWRMGGTAGWISRLRFVIDDLSSGCLA
jgi:hypothetical protein